MNAKEARKVVALFGQTFQEETTKEAFRIANFALIHEEKMERVAYLEATTEKVTLSLMDILLIRTQADTFERLLHHLPDDIVDHIGFICDAEMKDRYARRDKLEKECEA